MEGRAEIPLSRSISRETAVADHSGGGEVEERGHPRPRTQHHHDRAIAVEATASSSGDDDGANDTDDQGYEDQRILHSLRVSSQLESRLSDAAYEDPKSASVADSSNPERAFVNESNQAKDPSGFETKGHFSEGSLASRAAFLKMLASKKPGRGKVFIDFGIRGAFQDLVAAIKGQRPIKPSSRFRVGWDATMMFLICYGMIMIPFDIAFVVDIVPWMIFDVIIDCVFIVDVYLNFHTAYIGEDNDLVTDFGQIRYHYLKTWFFIDLLASIPFGSIDFALEAGSSNIEGLNTFKLLKVFRLLRMSHVFRSIAEMDNIKASVVVALLMIMFGVSAHWFACFYWKLGISQGEHSWITAQTKIPDLLQGNQVEQYVVSLYWAMSTVTTLGYGDLTPYSIPEYLYVTFVIFCGAAMYAVLVSSVSMIVVGRFAAEAEYNRQMESLRAFNKLYHLPPAVKQRIRAYYDCIWERRKSFSGQTVMRDLPIELRVVVASAVHAKMFQGSPLFRACDSYGFKHVFAAKLGPHVLRLPDDVLFFEDAKINHVYFIRNGLIDMVSALDTPQELVVGKRQGNGYCGDIGLFDPKPKHFVSAIAIQFSEVCTISVPDLMRIFEQFPKESMLFRRVAEMRRQAIDTLLSEFDEAVGRAPIHPGNVGEPSNSPQLITRSDRPMNDVFMRQKEYLNHVFLTKQKTDQSASEFWWKFWEKAVSPDADTELIDKIANAMEEESDAEASFSQHFPTNNTAFVDEKFVSSRSMDKTPRKDSFNLMDLPILSRTLKGSSADMQVDTFMGDDTSVAIAKSLETLIQQQEMLQREIGELRSAMMRALSGQ